MIRIPKIRFHRHKWVSVKLIDGNECFVCAKCHQKKVKNRLGEVFNDLYSAGEKYHQWLGTSVFVPPNPEGHIFYSNYFRKYAVVTNYVDKNNWFFSFLSDRMIKYKAQALPEELVWLEDGDYEDLLRWHGKSCLDE